MSYEIGITSALPFSEAQYGGVLRLLDGMGDGETVLYIRASNYADFGDFMAVYLEGRGDGFRVELDFPTDDGRKKFPPVLAGDLDEEETRRLLRELLVDVSGTEGSELVLRRFRQMPAPRCGGKEATEYRKDGMGKGELS